MLAAYTSVIVQENVNESMYIELIISPSFKNTEIIS